jgi:DNA-binding XRE family transcriptional regulator
MLRTSRKRAGLSQEAAAEAAGISRVVLAYCETERRQVPLSTAAALVRLYGTSLEALLSGGKLIGVGVDVSGLLFRAASPLSSAKPIRRIVDRDWPAER